jgi:hypothetical protein
LRAVTFRLLFIPGAAVEVIDSDYQAAEPMAADASPMIDPQPMVADAKSEEQACPSD